MEDNKMDVSVLEFMRIEVPVAKENKKNLSNSNYIQYGIYTRDDFFDTITNAYTRSTTNAACIEGISDLIYGKGLNSENEAYKEILNKVISQEDIKRNIFDLKLYGNSAFQIYWDDKHTKIIKIYHIPVQNIRAEKIFNTKVENYYYCSDWHDEFAKRNKIKIPVFGTSKEKMEILFIKNYTPSMYYYSLPDWFSAIELALTEAELSNLHYNNVANGFFPSAIIEFNNGIPDIEERRQNEHDIQNKFGGSKNAGRFMVLYNTSKENATTITPINVDNLHEKFKYVAEYTQDRILIAHRITSPLLFSVRSSNNGFSSNAQELQTGYSIMQTMTIFPFQNMIINNLNDVFEVGGYSDIKLYFEQLTPDVLLSIQAQQQNTTTSTVQDKITDNNKTIQ